ncbi:uncharacterized protein LOC135125255 [Zophobas morio]|uniref:uncharacterized protein LOC135125255 n=1 Tax=Zophobas morio TaxID=2755281 RepID=UPI003083D811
MFHLEPPSPDQQVLTESLLKICSPQIQVGEEFRSGTLTLEVPPGDLLGVLEIISTRQKQNLLVLVQVGSFFTIAPLFEFDQCFWFKFSGFDSVRWVNEYLSYDQESAFFMPT